MPSVLAVGALSSEAYRTKVARFLIDEYRDGPVRSVQVNLFNLNGVRVGINEWRPKEDEDPGGIAERIASYIVERQCAGATIVVQHDG